MIEIKIFKKNHLIVGFECSGHSGFADNGSDIVCAAVSAITLTACLGIEKVLGIKSMIKKDDNLGYLSLNLPNTVQKNDLEKSQIVFQTMKKGLLEIAKDYKKYIKIGG